MCIRDSVITAPPVAYDEDGVPINDVTFSVSEVSIKISLDDMKNVDINEHVQGTPASGYSISGIYTCLLYTSAMRSPSCISSYFLTASVNGRQSSFLYFLFMLRSIC